ncbi:Leucine-rich repeat and guanylate kinase domain-containing protein [Chlorella vulgaris]
MVKLSASLAATLAGQPADELYRLDASNKSITEVDLAACGKLNRLDVSKNNLVSVEGLNANLRWLSVASNQITSINLALEHLEVLNASNNQLSGKVAVGRLHALKALILNNNGGISLVGGLEKCPDLNTLVLSHNAVTSLGSSLKKSAKLEKLSLSHNQVTHLGSALQGCPMLIELRLNHNQLRALPDELASNTRLRIVECGGNPIASVADIQVLSQLPQLRSVSLKGCPLAATPDYRQRMAELLPRLEILDNQRIAERPRKQQQLDAAAAAAAAHASVQEPQATGQPAAATDAAPRRVAGPGAGHQRHAVDGIGQPAAAPRRSREQHTQQTAATAPHAQTQQQLPKKRKQEVALAAVAHRQQGGGEPSMQEALHLAVPEQVAPAEPSQSVDDGGAAEPRKKKPRKRSKPKSKAGGSAEAQAAAPADGGSDDDVADAAELLKQKPARQAQDPEKTGVLKVIDVRRQVKTKGAKGGKVQPVTGAQALKALLQPAAGVGTVAGLPSWD